MSDISKRLLEIKVELTKHEKEIKRLLDERKRLIDNCEHEINIITSETETRIKGYKKRSCIKCLICDSYLWPTKAVNEDIFGKMEKAIKIDLNNYPNFAKRHGEDCFGIVKMYYNIEKEFAKNLTEQEIAKKLIKIIEKIEDEEKSKQE